ncbi:MAG TPA: glycosyltransferase [Caulobacteraceae bacterium]|jgi:phosphatidylinositol alpha-1,6-mannosyltransferase
MSAPALQISAQTLSAGTSSGIARCARITLKSLATVANVTGLAVEDVAPSQIGATRTRAFGGSRPAFVAANAAAALGADWTIYDFAGTARAHSPLSLIGKRYAVWVHGIEVWPENLRADYAAAIRRAAAVFVNSRHTFDKLSASMPELKTKHLCLLGTEKDVGAGARPSASPREQMVLFVGRNDDMFYKGQDVLIAAWPSVVARAPGARLVFAGGGDRIDKVRALAAASAAAASIDVLGLVSEAELEQLYRRARLFAMPSSGEGFGLVFAEAMSHGLPVLTSTEDASMEVNAHGETGYSISRCDLDGIASAIVGTLTSDALFDRLSRNAYERWAREFSFTAFRTRFLQAATAAGVLAPEPAPVGWTPANKAAKAAKAQADGAIRTSELQSGNRSWWTQNLMSYDWREKIACEPYSAAWFEEVDRRFIESARHFAHDARPFDRIIPFDALAGKQVLEVGCGVGFHTELMANAGADVTAIDLSPRAIEATRARAALKTFDADIREQDVESLDAEDAYDFIWSWGVLHHSSRTGLALRRLHRALKPGGELRFMVYSLDGAQAYSVLMSRYLTGFWRGRSLDELLWQSTDGYLARYFTKDSLADLCRAFFDDVDLKVFGLESDAVPLPTALRRIVRPLFSDAYIADAVKRRGAFLFATARKQS